MTTSKQQAEQHLLHGQWEKAITAYDEAIKAAPGDAELWNDRGVALYRLGRYESAIENYRKALKLDRHNKTIWENAKRCLLCIYGKDAVDNAIAFFFSQAHAKN